MISSFISRSSLSCWRPHVFQGPTDAWVMWEVMVSGKGWRLMGFRKKNLEWLYAAPIEWDISFRKPFLGYHHFSQKDSRRAR